MANTITITGDELRRHIFGPHEYYTEEFYYQGSANARAGREQSRGNPNTESVPFAIPSRRYSDSYAMGHLQREVGMSQDQFENLKTPPNYIITGYTDLGGRIDSNISTIDWKDFKTGIIVNNCTFDLEVYIRYLNTNSYIRFSNCTFKNGVRLETMQTTDLSFTNCDFDHKTLNVFNCNIGNLSLTTCKNISIDIENDKKYSPRSSYKINNDIEHRLDLLAFVDITNADKITIAGQGIGKITFKDTVFKEAEFDVRIDGIQILNETSEESTTGPFLVKKFKAYADEHTGSFVSSLENLHIQEFTLTGTLKDAALIALALIIDKIQIQNFINEGKLRFNDVHLTHEGELVRSQLGKTEFNDVNFSQASRFKIYLCNITEIVTTNTVFPETIMGRDEKDLEGIREIYRQLKNAAGKQGDRVNELRYESIEMHVFEELLSTRRLSSDKWILKLNRWSNGYGQNWVRAGIILAIGSLGLFCLTRMCLGYRYLNWSLLF